MLIPHAHGSLFVFRASLIAFRFLFFVTRARWADTRRALELLVERLDRRDEVFFAAFAEKVGMAVPWTREHDQLTRAFNTLRPGGYTAFFDAVRLISPAFQRAAHGRKVLLVISDVLDSLVPRIKGRLSPVARPRTARGAGADRD